MKAGTRDAAGVFGAVLTAQMLTVAFIASALPAARASGVGPATALRAE